MYIYFDMNIYNRIFDSQSNLRVRFESMAIDIIFQMIDEGKYKLCWSFILEHENSKNPFLYRRMYINLLSKSCKTVISPDIEIKNISEKIIANSKAKIKDALHLACAIHRNCAYFITCDDKFIRTIQKHRDLLKDCTGSIKLFNPVDFIRRELNIDVIE